MKEILKKLLNDKSRTIPVVSFPIAEIIGKSVRDFVTSSEAQAEGMKFLADNYPVGAVFNMMDLSVEAEAFGAVVRIEDGKIPEVTGTVITDIEDAVNLRVPSVSEGRCPVFINGVKFAVERIKNVPVICGVIGPYSLACRLFGMTELMMECFDNPVSVKILLGKCTDFISDYVSALKCAGAGGVLLCEPAAGLLSPDMAEEFSFDFVKSVFLKAAADDFITAYHNCGASVSEMPELLSDLNADIYHFGNAVNISELIPLLPSDSIVSGNLDPLVLRTGSEDDIEREMKKIMAGCGKYPNFILSTGCDVPPGVSSGNLGVYFRIAGQLTN